jgi:hypothetical protein
VPRGTGATVGAVTAVTAAVAFPPGFAVAAVTAVTVEPRPPVRSSSVTIAESSCRVRTSRRGLRWPRHSTKCLMAVSYAAGRWEPRRSRRQDHALETAGDRNKKCF